MKKAGQKHFLNERLHDTSYVTEHRYTLSVNSFIQYSQSPNTRTSAATLRRFAGLLLLRKKLSSALKTLISYLRESKQIFVWVVLLAWQLGR